MSDKKRLVVIDGKSVFYRGYYAMPNLATKDGKPTGGVYGFAVMALEVLKKMDPDFVAVAWDKPKTNIARRREIYPKYKANRKPAPPDFYEQVPVLHELLDAFNWPFYEIDDHEADDIMATFADQAHEKGYETILVTSDQDVLQLIGSDTVVAALKKGLTNIDYYDEERFGKKYSMTPDQFIDYKALRGDPSDNLPGVAGVGEKTAIKLIEDYKSLDGVYDHLEEIKGSLKTKLSDNKDLAYITKELVILDKKVPLKLDWKQADVKNTDAKKVAQIIQDLEFKTLLNQLPEDMKQSAEEVKSSNKFNSTVKVESLDNVDKLKNLNLSASKNVVIETYPAGPVNKDLKLLLISPNPKKGYIIEVKNEEFKTELVKVLNEQLETSKLIAYDAKYSLKSLIQSGINEIEIEHDIRMSAFLLNSLIREQSLSALAMELGYEGSELSDISPEDMKEKADIILSVVWALHEAQVSKFTKQKKLQKLAKEVEWPLINVLAKAEIEGVGLDTKYLKEMSSDLTDRISDKQQEIYGHSGKEFNISSPSQLAEILFDELDLPTQGIKKGKKGYSTAASELLKLEGKHPIISLIGEYRELTKLKSTYVDPLPELVDENSRLHSTFSTWVAATGRLSSHDPNLQNIPIRSDLGKKIRRAFVAKKGHMFVSADYSQFELRLAAVLANDAELIESFNDGLDVHARTAAQIYGVAIEDVSKNQRRDAKVINFGILYGMSPHGLSVATGMSQQEAKSFIDKYFELRKPLLDYMDHLKKQAKENGSVETMFGRKRPTPDVNSSNFVVREAAYRAAINMPIQGTEADLMKMAMIQIDEKLDPDCKQILQIHDSILVEAPKDKAEKVSKMMKKTMENVYKLPVKLDVDVDIGENWGEF